MNIFHGRKLRPHKDPVSARDYNSMSDSVHQLTKSLSSAGISDAAGIHTRRTLSEINKVYIAKVDSNADGGGYYNCYLTILDADDWDTDNADQFDSIGDLVVVLNLAEVGIDIHDLDTGDLIVCWEHEDDEGNVRLVGNEVIGRHTFGEW
ncbi:MAG: hypothetical protein ACTSQB_00195 [Candidatus Heimdallarchaeota archaeon]